MERILMVSQDLDKADKMGTQPDVDLGAMAAPRLRRGWPGPGCPVISGGVRPAPCQPDAGDCRLCCLRRDGDGAGDFARRGLPLRVSERDAERTGEVRAAREEGRKPLRSGDEGELGGDIAPAVPTARGAARRKTYGTLCSPAKDSVDWRALEIEKPRFL